jgi:hypothetical protein
MRSATVTDRHIRILRLMARQSQRELRRHDAVDTVVSLREKMD